MEQTGKKNALWFLKVIALVIAIVALVYKIVFAVTRFDSISAWWQQSVFIYFALYMTSIITIVSTLLRGKIALFASLAVISISIFMLLGDGLAFLGFAASLNDTPMADMGIMPLVNVLNILAGILNVIGTGVSK